MNLEVKDRLDTKLRRELGSIVVEALLDPLVVEVMLNQDGSLWIERHGSGMVKAGRIPSSQAESMFATIATQLKTEVTRQNPILEGELPIDGSRFEGISMPVVGSPVFAIRKKASEIFTLEDYRDLGILSQFGDPLNAKAATAAGRKGNWVEPGSNHYEILKRAIHMRKNIVVVGSTGSGKTTFVNALLHEISVATPAHRLVVIEDTGELQCTAPNFVQLRSCAHVSMLDCLRATLRLRPDRIIVGEVRGREAHTLVKAWNTGHPGGILTLHANDAEAGLIRLQSLIQEDTDAPRELLIAEAVDLVVFIDKETEIKAGRKVRQIVEVLGFDVPTGRYLFKHH